MIVWLWIGFIVFVLAMLALDLGVLNRGAHIIRTRRALLFSAVCAGLALGFAVLVYFIYENNWLNVQSAGGERDGASAAMQFLTGWLIEQSLSLDNIFVIAMIFAYFGVPLQFQHHTLFWGILGALVMRLAMILIGIELINHLSWTIYAFGALLLLTAYRMLRSSHEKVDPDRNPLVRLARRFYPGSADFDGDRFFTTVPDGSGAGRRRALTPLFLALLAIESMDVLFAIDSIPAILAITDDRFIVFTSNVFAILNLRSLYFILADLLDRFRRLKYSLALILAYVGVKMILSHHVEIPISASLSFIIVLLFLGILASLRGRRAAAKNGPEMRGSDPPP